MSISGGIAGQALPAPVANGANVVQRMSRDGSALVFNTALEREAAAAEGRHFKVVNPTSGTAVAQGVQTTFSDTANVLAILQNPVGSARRVIFDYLRLINVTAGTGATSAHLAVVLSDSLRRSAGGTAAFGGNCLSSALGTSSMSQLFFGALTATARGANDKTLHRSVLKTQAAPCWSVGDELVLACQETNHGIGPASGAAAVSLKKIVGPLIIDPGHSVLFHLWSPGASAAPTWEYETAWVERDL